MPELNNGLGGLARDSSKTELELELVTGLETEVKQIAKDKTGTGLWRQRRSWRFKAEPELDMEDRCKDI